MGIHGAPPFPSLTTTLINATCDDCHHYLHQSKKVDIHATWEEVMEDFDCQLSEVCASENLRTAYFACLAILMQKYI